MKTHQKPTLADRFDGHGAALTGFDYIRVVLSLLIMMWHSIYLSLGSVALDRSLWSGPFRFIPASYLPIFFALSGFLVAGSLARTRLHQFVVLRLVRIFPALAVEIALCAMLLGPIFTTVSLHEYFRSPLFWNYFQNIIGNIQFQLPGLFDSNRGGSTINAQLWTIPFEFECYASLAILAILGVARRRTLFLAMIVVMLGMGTYVAFKVDPPNPYSHVPGRALVLSFLCGVLVYLYRDRLSFSGRWWVASAILMFALLQWTKGCYLAALPTAYFTAYIGMLRPPKLSFGDLSYGVFLFHFPIEQTLEHLFPRLNRPGTLFFAALPFVYVMAKLSWTCIEEPILKRKKFILRWADALHELLIGLLSRVLRRSDQLVH